MGGEPDEKNNLFISFHLGDSLQEIVNGRRIVETEVDEVERIKENRQLEIERQHLKAVLGGTFFLYLHFLFM